MIAHKLKTVFIHITKTAGSSVEVALDSVEQRNAGTRDPATGEQVAVVTGDEKHMTAEQCQAALGVEAWQSYFKFSVVRNPWDRFHSLWWNGRHVGKHHALSLSEFTDYYLHRTLAGRVASLRKGQLRIHQRFRPQVQWLRSKNGKVEMDYICRFETIKEDFATVSRKIGLPSTELPRVLVKNRNPESRRNYREDFDDKTESIISRYYAADIDAFGYRFAD